MNSVLLFLDGQLSFHEIPGHLSVPERSLWAKQLCLQQQLDCFGAKTALGSYSHEGETLALVIAEQSRYVGIGVDLCNPQRIAAVWQQNGQRFAERILHPGERTDIDWTDPVDSLAWRWAIKEAVFKAVPAGRVLYWQEIEVRQQAAQWTVRLYGEIAQRAQAAGADAINLTLSQHAGMCCVVALLPRK